MVYSMKNKQNPNFSLRKLILTALVSGTVATVPAPLWAVPDITSANLTTSSSAVQVSLSGTSVSVTAPDKSVLSWKDFGAAGSPINAGDTLNYFLPTASSSVLNLVTGTNPSTVNGTIASNGNVYLLNANGITIGGTAQINTGGFYASTINDSLASNSFQQTGTILTSGPVANNITVSNGAALQALGSGNNIKLYGKQVIVDGGNFYGNLTVTSYNSGANGASFAGSNNPVTVNQVNAAGGNLTVVTNGGNVVLSGGAGGTLNVAGATTLDSTGSAAVGSIATGVAAFNGTAFNATATNSVGSGNITVGSGKVTSLTATGNNISVTVSDGAAMAVGNVTAAGTLTITNNYDVISNANTTVTAAGNVVASAVGGNNNLTLTGNGNLTFTSLVGSSTAKVTSNGNIDTSAAGVTSRNLVLSTTSGTITTAALTANTTALTLSAPGDITVNGAFSASQTSGSTVSVTSTAGKVTFGGTVVSNSTTTISSYGPIAFASSAAFGASTSTVTATTGDVTVGTTLDNGNGGLTVKSTAGTVTIGTGINNTGTGLMSIVAAGNVSLPTTTRTQLSVTSTAGSISQTGAITSASTATFNAAGDILLTNVLNNFNNIVLQGGAGTGTFATPIQVAESNNIVVQGGTATKGNVSVTTTAGYIQLGKSTTDLAGNAINGTDSLTFGGNLTLTTGAASPVVNNKNNPLANAAGSINTFANNLYIYGDVSLNTTNQNAILGTPGLGNLANYSYGAIKAALGTGNLSVTENTTLNLGLITANSVFATSIAGDIVNKGGALTIGGDLTVNAGSIFSPNNVTLDNASAVGSNSIVGKLVLGNVNNLVATVGKAAGTASVQAGGATTFVTDAAGVLQLGAPLATRSVVGSATVTGVAGTAVLALTTAGSGDYNIVGVTTSGATNATIADPNSVTIQNATNTGTGTLSVTANAGTVSLGSGISLNSTGATTINGGSIADVAPNIFVAGALNLNSQNGISITKSGHSAGPVTINSGLLGAAATTADVTYTEGGTANLACVTINALAPSGNLTVVSTGGSVIQSGAGSISVPVGTANKATFQAAAGVTLTDPGVGNNITAPITLTAATDSSVKQAAATTLNNVKVTAGALLVDVSAGANAITQVAGSTVNIFGNSAFKAAAGAITLANSGNSFGALSLSSTTGAISVKESGTVNLASVATTGAAGTFTAVSENAGIIETNSAYAGFVQGINVNGAVSLTAQAAGVTLNANNNFNSKVVTIASLGNVTLQDAGVTTLLGTGTNVTGALVIRNTNGAGTISDGSVGGLTVSGSVLLDSGSGNILINGSGNAFGAVQFRANAVTIVQNTSFNLAAGSVASGNVTISTNGDFLTSGAGTSTFAGAGGVVTPSLYITAGGKITITNPIFVNNVLQFRALGAVDLSALSLIGNLNGVTPVNLGAASYKAPAQ